MSYDPEKYRRNLQRRITRILSDPFWPPKLELKDYATTHDDNDGKPASGFLTVAFSKDGDAWIETFGGVLRFRSVIGGSRFPKIRNALLLLAEAIRQEGISPFPEGRGGVCPLPDKGGSDG